MAALTRNTARVLVKIAAANGAGLIVMGCLGCSDLTSLLLGRVAHAVLHHNHCSVLIVRWPCGP